MTELTPRWPFVDCPTHWLSSYDNYPVAQMEHGINAQIPAPMVPAAQGFIDAIERRNGRFRFTGYGRSYETSQRLHLEWQADNSKTYAKPGGYSMHNSWRAIDPDIGGSGLSKAQWDEAATESGWSFISNEAGHFEWRQGAAHIMERYGVDQMAMACTLAAGLGWFGNDHARAVQAGLHFAGVDPGIIDGVIGTKAVEAAISLEASAYA